VHYGPKSYDDQAEVEKYLIDPGIDTNIFTDPIIAGNNSDIYFYKRQYRMRPGSHHLIVMGEGQGSILGTGRRLGGSQNSIKDNPKGRIPPENVGIGMPLKANANLILNLHHFNGQSKPLLREAWVNFLYIDPTTVKQEAKEIFLWAFGQAIPPGGRATVRGKKTISEAGRILTLYGHRHSNNVRFSAYVNGRLVFDDYDWKEPAVFEFNSLTENPAPEISAGRAGALSGKLELNVGDLLEWQCDIENHHSEPITFGENEAITSEMCILVGDAVGPALLGLSEL
jgi:hypothetical protein